MSLEPRSGLSRRDPLAAVLGLSVVAMLGIAAAQDQRAGCRLVPHDAPAVEEWACAISAGGPHFRFRVVPDSADDEGSYRILVLP
ncbi:MAG: hypothetical protein HYS40_00545, partial [Gemmatimonadetes bacterium]|nr:hypothetical protein [Gemmatimonadota bacterium]